MMSSAVEQSEARRQEALSCIERAREVRKHVGRPTTDHVERRCVVSELLSRRRAPLKALVPAAPPLDVLMPAAPPVHLKVLLPSARQRVRPRGVLHRAP